VLTNKKQIKTKLQYKVQNIVLDYWNVGERNLFYCLNNLFALNESTRKYVKVAVSILL